MNDTKTLQVNFRLSPKAKQLLKIAAAREHRSATNMVEYLVYQYCDQNGIDLPPEGEPPTKKPKGAKGAGANSQTTSK